MLNRLAAAPAAVLATASTIRIERAKSVELFWLLILFPYLVHLLSLFLLLKRTESQRYRK